MGDYYRIALDGRDLNYNKFFTDGEANQAPIDDFTSENTEQLSVTGVVDLMRTIPEVTAFL